MVLVVVNIDGGYGEVSNVYENDVASWNEAMKIKDEALSQYGRGLCEVRVTPKSGKTYRYGGIRNAR